MKKIIFIVLTLTFVLNVDLAAQEKWKLSGQIRQRFEMDDKDFDSETNSNNFNLLRSRLGITFAPEEDVTAFFQVQDSRTFGEETSTLGDGSADNIDLHQGYIKIKNLFDLPTTKVGWRRRLAQHRQKFRWRDFQFTRQRLLG
jgi:hypothetical protein